MGRGREKQRWEKVHGECRTRRKEVVGARVSRQKTHLDAAQRHPPAQARMQSASLPYTIVCLDDSSESGPA